MGSSPRPAGGGTHVLDGAACAGASPHEPSTDTAAGRGTSGHEPSGHERSRHEPSGGVGPADGGSCGAAEAAAGVRDALECVFDAVAETRTDCAQLLAAVAADGRRPATADLAALRPGLHERLARLSLMSGAGFVAAPGLLADAGAWLEWWQTGPGGDVRPLLLDLDPEHSAYSDYTHWEWYALARDTGRRAVAGPYVDYLCSDEYSLTLSLPVTVDGRFTGVAAADVYLPDFEAAVMPVLQRLPGPACLVNSRGRVAVSTYARHLAGSLLKGPDFASAVTAAGTGAGAETDRTAGSRDESASTGSDGAGESAGHASSPGHAGPVEQDGLSLWPCGDIPLILVTAGPEGAATDK